MGGGQSGPSPQDIEAEDNAAALQAQNQTNMMTEQQNLEKQRASEAAVAAATSQANSSSLLAQQQQQLTAGAAANPQNNLETLVNSNPTPTGNILTGGKAAAPAAPVKGVG